MKQFVPVLLLAAALLSACGAKFNINRVNGIVGPNAPVLSGRGVLFRLSAPDAHSVSIVGDFNSWDPTATPMEKQGGIWSIKINLPYGSKYYYQYVVDGYIIPDPDNPVYHISSYGTSTSVIDLRNLWGR